MSTSNGHSPKPPSAGILKTTKLVDALPPRKLARSPLLLSLRNFLFHKKLNVYLPETGLVQLAGPSGCGKTSVLEAIYFCLYGRMSTNTSSKPQSFGEKSCSVTIELSNMDIVIHRNRSPNRIIVVDTALQERVENETAQEFLNSLFGTEAHFKLSCYIIQNAPTLLDISPGELSNSIKSLISDKQTEEYSRTVQGYLTSERAKVREALEKCNVDRRTHEQLLQEYEEELEGAKTAAAATMKTHEKGLTEEVLARLESEDLDHITEEKKRLHLEYNDLMGRRTGASEEKCESLRATIATLKARVELLRDESDQLLSTETVTALRESRDVVKRIVSQLFTNKTNQERAKQLKESIKETTTNLKREGLLSFNEREYESLQLQHRKVAGCIIDEQTLSTISSLTTRYECPPPDLEDALRSVEKEQMTQIEEMRKTVGEEREGKILGPLSCPKCEGKIFIHEEKAFEVDKPEDYKKTLQKLRTLDADLISIKRERGIVENYTALLDKNRERIDLERQLEEMMVKRKKVMKNQAELEHEKKLLKESKEAIKPLRVAELKRLLTPTIELLEKNIGPNECETPSTSHQNEEMLAAVQSEGRLLLKSKGALVRFTKSEKGLDSLTSLEKALHEACIVERNRASATASNKRRIEDAEHDIANIKAELESLEGKEDVTALLRKASADLIEIRMLHAILEERERIRTIEVKRNERMEMLEETRSVIGNHLKRQDDISTLLSLLKRASLLTLQNYIDTLNVSLEEALCDVFDEPIDITFKLLHSKTAKAKLETGHFSEEEFDLTSVKLQPTIVYKGEEYPSARYFSGGEKQRFNLALLYALSKSFVTPLLFIDEGLNNLNESTNSDILLKLKEWAAHRTIVVVSHEAIEGMFDRVIRIDSKQ